MELLEKLGYSKKEGSYCHATRRVLFIGDYIDRGPKIRETLIIVRQMVESGNAITLVDSHEYNALCFHHEESEGGHLRKHLIKSTLFSTSKRSNGFKTNRRSMEITLNGSRLCHSIMKQMISGQFMPAGIVATTLSLVLN